MDFFSKPYLITIWHKNIKWGNILTAESGLLSNAIWKNTQTNSCTTGYYLCNFYWTVRSLSILHRSKPLWTYVQTPYGRTSLPPHAVRADTLWTYVHTANAVRPRDFHKGKWTFCTLMPLFLCPLGAEYLPVQSTQSGFIAFSERLRMSKWKQIHLYSSGDISWRNVYQSGICLLIL